MIRWVRDEVQGSYNQAISIVMSLLLSSSSVGQVIVGSYIQLSSGCNYPGPPSRGH